MTFLKVDTDAHPALAATHGATVLPTFTFYRHGKEVPGSKLHGYKKKPLADAVAALAKA